MSLEVEVQVFLAYTEYPTAIYKSLLTIRGTASYVANGNCSTTLQYSVR